MRKNTYSPGAIILLVIFFTCHVVYASQLEDMLSSGYKSLTGAYSSLLTKGFTETLRTSPRTMGVYSALGGMKNYALTNLGNAGNLVKGLAISSALGPIGQVGYIASKAIGISPSSLLGRGISAGNSFYLNSISPRINMLNQNLGTLKNNVLTNLGNMGSLTRGLSISSALGPVGSFSYLATKAAGVSPGLILDKGISLMKSAGIDFYANSISPKVNSINNTLINLRANTEKHVNNFGQSIISYLSKNSNIESKKSFFDLSQQKSLTVERKIISSNK